MGFLDKIKNSVNEAQHLAENFKNQINIGESSTTSSTPVHTPATTVASTPAPSVAAPRDMSSLEVKIPHSTAPGAPEKIPLADRKKLRDDWDAKKPELEAEFSKLLGTQWTIYVDVTGVYSYMNNDSNALKNPGAYIVNYFKGALNHLKLYVEKNGAADAAAINEFAPNHLVTLEPTTDATVNYNSVDFVDGRWRLLFRDTKFGWNAQDVGQSLGQALNNASKAAGGATALSIVAKQGIRDQYEPKIADLLKKAREWLADPNLVFEPNFETNYAVLTGAGDKVRKDWEKTLGPATYQYFDGFVNQLDWQKFKGDDLMQEGFKDLVSKSKVAFVVTPDVKRARNDTIIEDGVLYLRCKPDQWWVNVNDTADQLAKLL